ncbi:protein KASH5 isoform X2 [Ascaphus truei]|uniref:protein KASH5 isoform X2 n=1 Tax=Ascaphus truei TaxID=8439 RepID=UPI003F59200D
MSAESFHPEDAVTCSDNGSQDCLLYSLNSSSEDQMLDSAFQVCDPDGRGKVSVFQIIEYLQSVTDHSCDGDRLQCLCKMLDPENQGAILDLQTFRTVMREWIASCCQDGALEGTRENEKLMKDLCRLPSEEKEISSGAQLEGYGGDVQKFMGEHSDLMSKVKDLNYANRKMIDEKTKLQRSLELAEENNTHLTEEIFDLKSKLKSSQQAVHYSRSVRNELEDMKSVTKSLEEKIGDLSSQKKQLEKEKQSLSIQKQSLQEENDKLLTEIEKAKGKIDGLSAENVRLMHQLCEYEGFLLHKDMLLAEKGIQAEELQGILEEHKAMIQELKMENKCLQEQLFQTHEAIRIDDSQNQPSSSLQAASVLSVCMEIEEMHERGRNMKSGLSSPLCGIFRCSDSSTLLQDMNSEMTSDDFWAMTELLLVQLKQGTDALVAELQQISWPDDSIKYVSETLQCQLEKQSDILLQRLSCLVQLKSVWETHSSKLNGELQIYKEKEPFHHLRTSAKDSEEGMEKAENESGDHLSLESRADEIDYQQNRKISQNCPGSATARGPAYGTNMSLLPVNNQLIPFRRHNLTHPRYTFFGGMVPRFRTDQGHPLEQFCIQLREHSSVLGLLLLIVLLGTLLLCPIWSGEHIWTVMKGVMWPHIHLRYLKPPPF